MPHPTRLLIPIGEAYALASANPDAATLITTGSGDNRVLVADEFLDMVVAFVEPRPAQKSIPADPVRAVSRRAVARPREVVTT